MAGGAVERIFFAWVCGVGVNAGAAVDKIDFAVLVGVDVLGDENHDPKNAMLLIINC